MAPKKTTKKLTGTRKNKLIEQLFNQHGNRRQFNVMDLGKISRAAETAYDAAATHDDGLVAADAAMRAACDKYEVRPVDRCLTATLDDAAKDAPPGEGDFDFAIPGLRL